jgi:hypothetical protein
MKRWRGAAIAFAALLMLAAAACGGRGTVLVGSGTPPAWAAAPGWVKVAASSGSLGDSWAYSPYFRVDGGRVRVVGSLTSDDPGRFRWEVRLVPRKPGVDAGELGVMMRKTADNPARSDELYFEGISERPLAAGDHRVAIWGSPGTYSVTVYVHE